MKTEKMILKYIHESFDKFLDLVEISPFMILYEADLRSMLYMTLFNYRKIFRQSFYDQETDVRTNLLHTEYYYKMGGFYDIVILDPKKLSEGTYLKEKPILVGFELKLKENKGLASVYNEMENDSYAFDNRSHVRSAKYGFVVFVNVDANNQQKDRNKLKKQLKALKKKRNLKRVWFYYIEIPEEIDEDIWIEQV